MKVEIGDYSVEAQSVYAVVKRKDGTYELVLNGDFEPVECIEECKHLRDYAMCEIADWLAEQGLTKSQAIHVFASAVIGE